MSVALTPTTPLLNVLRASPIATSQRLRLASPIVALQLKRTYFSIHHPDLPPFAETQARVLSAAINRVPEYGFTQKALALGAKDAGYLDVTVQLFPRGIFDLINYHLVAQRLALKDNLQFPEKGGLGLGAKVHTLAMTRLRANADIIQHWQAALGYMSLLENIPDSLKELSALSDEIWHLAGDTTVDFSWYTKRASLASVYASTEMFMTTDTSNNFAATEEFLVRRLEDAQIVGGTLGGFRTLSCGSQDPKLGPFVRSKNHVTLVWEVANELKGLGMKVNLSHGSKSCHPNALHTHITFLPPIAEYLFSVARTRRYDAKRTNVLQTMNAAAIGSEGPVKEEVVPEPRRVRIPGVVEADSMGPWFDRTTTQFVTAIVATTVGPN